MDQEKPGEELFPDPVAEAQTPEAPDQPKEPEPAPEAPQEPPPAEPEPKLVEAAESHTVPLAKYLDTRDELKELKRWKAEQEAKQQPAAKAPDPVDDPQGYARFHTEAVEQRVTGLKFDMSDQMARQAHGVETVEKATEWALERAHKDPVFAAQYMREPHPIDWIVRQHQRDGLVQQLPPDVSSLDELIEREIAKRGLSAPPAAPAPAEAAKPQQASGPAAPTPSLVNVPGSGVAIGETAIGPTAILEDVFPR